ncbi:MAG TPA: putative Ig domain-containing protein [Thermoanaerobaculia bacterium]|nr:putative Ig domain-containing protein [Thermoanaerobaculia bacterium]
MRKVILVAIVSLCLAATALADCSTFTNLTESLSDFRLNQPVQFQIEFIGGTAPYHFEIVDGTLPQGLHLTANGKIVGKPTEVADTTVLVRVTDAEGCTLHVAYAVRVY